MNQTKFDALEYKPVNKVQRTNLLTQPIGKKSNLKQYSLQYLQEEEIAQKKGLDPASKDSKSDKVNLLLSTTFSFLSPISMFRNIK